MFLNIEIFRRGRGFGVIGNFRSMNYVRTSSMRIQEIEVIREVVEGFRKEVEEIKKEVGVRPFSDEESHPDGVLPRGGHEDEFKEYEEIVMKEYNEGDRKKTIDEKIRLRKETLAEIDKLEKYKNSIHNKASFFTSPGSATSQGPRSEEYATFHQSKIDYALLKDTTRFTG